LREPTRPPKGAVIRVLESWALTRSRSASATDRAAFEAHLETGHFLEFDRRVKDWLISKKAEFWERFEIDCGIAAKNSR